MVAQSLMPILYFKQSDRTEVNFTGADCISGYRLIDIDTNSDQQKCQCDNARENRILLCEDDQDSIIIEVSLNHNNDSYIFLTLNVLLFLYRKVCGPVTRRDLFSFICVLLDTVVAF